MSLVRNTLTIGGLTLVSRIFGFLRDVLMARFVGAGFASDAFLIAWRLPNLFRALFAEGAFSAAFVPMFNRIVGRETADGRDGLPAALLFAEQVLAALFPVLLVFTALMMWAAGPIVWAMTGGFPGGTPEKLALAIDYTRITFPYLLLISLVSLLGGILNSLDRFWVNAAAPILLNLCMIAALIFFRGATEVETARMQAIAVTASGMLQLAWLVWACRRAGVSLRLRPPRLTPEVRRMLALIGPAALGAGAVQFNLLISTTLAARFLPEGSVSWLYYADRLNQLPLGLIGIGVGTAILPALSRQIGKGDNAAANDTQCRAIELVLLLTLPAFAGLILCAQPIIRGTMEYGAFSAADTTATAAALSAFATGLPAYVLIKVLVPGFYARADTRTPVRVALLTMLVNLALNLALVWPLGHVGLALSTAVAAWVNAAILWWLLHRHGHLAIDARLRRRARGLLAATLVLAAALYGLNLLAAPLLAGSVASRVAGLTVLLGLAAIIYFAAAALFGGFVPADLRTLLRRRRA